MSNPKIPAKVVWREYIESLIVAILLALALRFFVVTAYKIPSSSMAPTLVIGDFIFAYRPAYGISVPFFEGLRLGEAIPERGEVVVFRAPGQESVRFVKRVVGLPGDRIEIKNGALWINEKMASYQLLTEVASSPELETSARWRSRRESLGENSHLVMDRVEDDAAVFGPVVVPPQHVFVLGDNRSDSEDSRYWGSVPAKNLEGRVFLIWMSFDWSALPKGERLPSIRGSRIGTIVR